MHPLERYLPTELAARARDLQDAGVASLAWHRDDALAVVEQLAAKGVAIAGGDVWERDGSVPQRTRETWSCELDAASSASSDIARCAEAATAFIARYPSNSSLLFEFVARIDATGA